MSGELQGRRGLYAVAEPGCRGLRKHGFFAGQLGRGKEEDMALTALEGETVGNQKPTRQEELWEPKLGVGSPVSRSRFPSAVEDNSCILGQGRPGQREVVPCRQHTCPNKPLTGAPGREGPGAQALTAVPRVTSHSESGREHPHSYPHSTSTKTRHALLIPTLLGREAGVVQQGRLTSVQNTFLAPPFL